MGLENVEAIAAVVGIDMIAYGRNGAVWVRPFNERKWLVSLAMR
jgi:hypothetical protein